MIADERILSGGIMNRFIIVLSVAAGMLLGAPRVLAQVDEFSALNAEFRATYRDARAAALAGAGPVIFVAFDSLILINGAERREEGFTPPVYHRLKAVGHLVFAAQLLLDPRIAAGPLSEQARVRVAALIERARAVQAVLDAALTPAQANRARRSIMATVAYMEQALQSGRPSQAAFDAWLAPLVPEILADVEDVAVAQLDALHVLVMRWRADMGEERWARLTVLVPVPRQPRRDNVQYAYFVRLLGADAAERRVIFTEGIYRPEPALELLGTILVDRSAGVAFFGDGERMERDLLGDAAQHHLNRLFPR